jgi:hypothetical protein
LIEMVGEAHEVRQTFDRINRQSSIPAASAGRIAAALEEVWTDIVPDGDGATTAAPPGAPGVTLALFVYSLTAQAGTGGAEQPALSHLPEDMAFFVVHKPPPAAGDTDQDGHWIGLYLYGE